MESNKRNQDDMVTNADNIADESSVTMLDVLEEEKAMEEEYAAVLGGSDEKCCTFSVGAVKRQALYSCLTCCPDSRENLENCAGICLACSYRCHENHELVELYTKRNFRCDCPTVKFNYNKCVLNSALNGVQQPRNIDNLYNQNFQGLYCNCHRPYPDPERTTEETMLQCTVCEDWFHLQHMDTPPSAMKLVDNCCEMICDSCMEKNEFLHNYAGLTLKAVENVDDAVMNVTVDGTTATIVDDGENDKKLYCDLDKSITDIINMTEVEKDEKPNCSKNVNEEPEMKRRKLHDDTITTKSDNECGRPKTKTDYIKGATFWGNDWRNALCKCTSCLDMYKKLNIEYIIDTEDSAKAYEERGMQRIKTESSYERGIRALATMDRTQQIDAITEYNVMKDKLKEYLQKFVETKKVVTEEDINRFFNEMRNARNESKVEQTYFCR